MKGKTLKKYIANIKERANPIIVSAKNASSAKKWVKKMGLTLKGSVKAVSTIAKKKKR